ncbi:MAG TPA: sulfatase [Thermoanaerobaculia bacterium]|nr:sulfatase [Thermoanaerobaculia bacterium]
MPFKAVCATVLAILPLTGLLLGCGRTAPRDNVVLVVIDTLRPDHLATYGYGRDTAPFLGSLARQGVVFDGLSTSSWTKPATASLLTGLLPVRHQAFARRDRLPADVVTLAQRLKDLGYRTVGASANGWVSPTFGFDRGFDTFLLEENVSAGVLVDDLLHRLDGLQTPLRPPYFLYLHLIDPHLPYDPPRAWDGGPLPAALRGHPVTLDEVDATHVRQRSPELMARARDLYDGEIREADRGLETTVRWLTGHGLMRGTVLVATADHGEEMGEHGRMSHGQTLYEEVVRVPLVVYAPHRVPGGRRLGTASLLDVVPTLADLLGMRARGLDGLSLAGLLRRDRSAPPPPADRRPFLLHLDFQDGTALALREGSSKLILSDRPYRKELFDLRGDPGEAHGVLDQTTGAELERLGSEMADLYNSGSRAAAERVSVSMTDTLAQRLAALGYISVSQAPAPRWIPRRIGLPDPFPDGRLGWERETAARSCVDLGAPGAGHSVLAGWYEAEQGGRWTAPAASLALPLAAGGDRPGRLLVSGANFRPAPVRLRVSVERHAVLDTVVPPGGFRLDASLAGAPVQTPLLVEIWTATPFVPAALGMGADARTLGVFLSSVCAK